MKKISLLLLALTLLGCQATSTKVEPVFASKIIEIPADELASY